jgi:hypothetical protein
MPRRDADTKFSSLERVPIDLNPAVSGADGDGEKASHPALALAG